MDAWCSNDPTVLYLPPGEAQHQLRHLLLGHSSSDVSAKDKYGNIALHITACTVLNILSGSSSKRKADTGISPRSSHADILSERTFLLSTSLDHNLCACHHQEAPPELK